MAITPYAFVSPTVRMPEDKVEARRNPHQSVSVIPEEYAILNGRPRVPMIWCNGEAAITTNGTYYTERPGIHEITDDSIVSFAPSDDDWDPVTLVWDPYVDNSATRYRLEGVQGSAPILDSVEYTIGRELFDSPSIRVSGGQPLSSNFNSGADDSTDFTFALAINVREIGNVPLVIFGDDSEIFLAENGMQVNFDEYSFSVAVPYNLVTQSPIYVVFDLTASQATLTVGLSPTKVYKGSTPISSRTVSFAFSLAAEVDIFAMDLWGDEAPSPLEIISRYSSVLGAH